MRDLVSPAIFERVIVPLAWPQSAQAWTNDRKEFTALNESCEYTRCVVFDFSTSSGSCVGVSCSHSHSLSSCYFSVQWALMPSAPLASVGT